MKVRALSAVHPAHITSQAGYILMTTITSMVVCLIIVTSLIGVTLANMKVEETGRQGERQDRAAEAALNTVINQIRNDPTAAAASGPDHPDGPGLKQPGDPGYDSTKAPWEQAPKDPGENDGFPYTPERDPRINPHLNNAACLPVEDLIEVDGVLARVHCQNDGLTDDPNVPGIPTDDGAVAVRLVGGEYQGNVGAEYTGFTDRARTWGTSIPWTTITGQSSGVVSTEVGNADAQLIHDGANPLQIFGGLELRHQIAAATPTGPALDVQGTAAQGQTGLFAGASSTEDPITNCGIAEVDDSYGAVRADVQVESIFDPSRSGLFCDDDELANMGAGGLPPGSGDWDNARVWERKAMPDRGGTPQQELHPDCDSYGSSVISLEGSFNAQQTKILNGWFSNDPTKACPNRTFIFEGDLFFDVYDPSLPETDPRRHSLVFDNREISWIFGKPTSPGRPLNAAFPDACNRNAPTVTGEYWGANITLSSRTGLFHRSGRVAICGPITVGGTHTTAISQRTATSLGSRLLPTTTSVGGFYASPAGDPAANLQVVGESPRRTLRVDHPITPSCWVSGVTPACNTAYSFTAGGFGLDETLHGADPGPGPLGSAWIDLTADGEWVNDGGNSTSFVLTLADGTTTCSKQYGPGAGVANRQPDNFATLSYNLLAAEGAGNCDEVLTGPGIGREDLRGASVTVTMTVDPPYQRNTKWGWFNWVCELLADFGDWTGWYNLDCDSRPSHGKIEVDAIAIRTGWTPSTDEPYNASDTHICTNCAPVTNAPGAERANDGAWARVDHDGTRNHSNLRFVLRDPTLLDGFLPVETVTFNARARRSEGLTGHIHFVLRNEFGVECRAKEELEDLHEGTTGWTDVPVTMDTSVAGTCTRNGSPTTHVDIGELITNRQPLPGGGMGDRVASLDVEVDSQTGSNRWVEIDYATMQATAGGYDRPLDPFTVTWNPLTPDPSVPTNGRPGDATFNVFGSVSVPNNDVRVVWNWGGANAAGPLGTPIFTAGDTLWQNCNLTKSDGCRPALVASALGSWTTGSWPANPTVHERPDPLASSGATRKPIRKVTLTACIIDDNGTDTQADDRLTPRAQATLHVSDVDGTVPASGAEVRVQQWRTFRSGVGVDGANAHTAPCGRPAMLSYE